MKIEKPTLLSWLGIKSKFDYTKIQWLGPLISLLLIFISLSLIAISLLGLFHLLGAFLGIGPYGTDITGEAIRNIGLVLVATFGSPFLAWRAIIAQKQVNVIEQGHITDRINESIKGLGSEKTIREIFEKQLYQTDKNDWKRDQDQKLIPALRPDGEPLIERESYERTCPNLEVRIGAIYALERIAQDSPRDHIQIMEILCAYLRENAPAISVIPTEELETRTRPRVDIQAAISVIGRRTGEQIIIEQNQMFKLDLRNTDLSGVDFRKGNFSSAMFHECRFEAAFFDDSILIGTQFFNALLNYSTFHRSKLKGTRFDYAIINKPNTVAGGMARSINMGEIYGISIIGADISAIDYLGEPKENKIIFGTKDTKLCSSFEFERESHEDQHPSDIKNVVEWSPYPSSDGACIYLYNKFLDKLDLVGWPYQ